MAYEVTATRRRPQKFEDLIGQEFVAQTFKNSIQAGKIAHAYLFSGPRGCGKTSTARIFAKALNCVNGPTANPCGECPICKEITAGSCFDVIEIDGASNTSVNDVRQIKDEILFSPNSCRYKIYIIDEVHMLSKQAYNALLKTIEEPPHYAIFVFATTELQAVPVTIKSRCQQFNFRLVPIEKVKEQLSLAAQELNIKAEDEALYWIAREAGGSMRDSYTLFDQVAAFSGDEITYDKIRDKLGLVGVDRLNLLFELCVDNKSEDVLINLDNFLQNGLSIDQLISNCSDYLRSLLLIKSGVRKEALLGQSAERFSQKVLDAWNNIKIERALSIFLQLHRDVRYSLSPRFELELAFSRLCWLSEYVSPMEVKKAIDAVKPLLSSASLPRKIQVYENASEASNASESSDAVVETVVPQEKEDVNSSASLPTGMPTFSALQSNSQDPFYKGGAEPPVNKSAAFDLTNNFDDYSDVNVEENDFSMDENREEEIPYDDSSKEEYYANVAVEESSDVSEDTFKPVDVNNIDLSNLDDVKAALITELSMSKPSVVGIILGSVKWKLEGEKLSFAVKSEHHLVQLKANYAMLREIVSKIYNRNISLEFFVEEEVAEVKQVELPSSVQLIKDVFNGSVLGWN